VEAVIASLAEPASDVMQAKQTDDAPGDGVTIAIFKKIIPVMPSSEKRNRASDSTNGRAALNGYSD
jgi:hypothetical protein